MKKQKADGNIDGKIESQKFYRVYKYNQGDYSVEIVTSNNDGVSPANINLLRKIGRVEVRINYYLSDSGELSGPSVDLHLDGSCHAAIEVGNSFYASHMVLMRDRDVYEGELARAVRQFVDEL